MKKVEINGISFDVTPDFISRIECSIKETERLLNKELKYREDLQKKDMVDYYKNHIQYLNSLIS